MDVKLLKIWISAVFLLQLGTLMASAQYGSTIREDRFWDYSINDACDGKSVEYGYHFNYTSGSQRYIDLYTVRDGDGNVIYSSEEAGMPELKEDITETSDNPPRIVDLHGRSVHHPSAGNIYFVDGRKVLWE